MVAFRSSSSAAYAVAAALALLSPAPASALEPAGSIPEAYFSEDKPSVVVETVNDSTGTCAGRVETDDRRSFALRAYGSWRSFALALACDGFTFRGDYPDPGTRSDELSITAAWMGRPLGDDALSARLGAGAGLRAWGDFGFEAIQSLWHDVLGVTRPFPATFIAPTLRPFAYASADVDLGAALPVGGEASVRELVLGSGGIESSISLLASWRGRLSESWAGLSHQGRLGRFDEGDSLANEYEEGFWAVMGARTGFLSVESSLNLRTNFAIGTISLRFGNPRPEGPGSGPRQELAIGTSVLESELSTARFAAFPLRGVELRLGIEAVVGVSRFVWHDLGYPHFQEASAVVELIAPERGRVLSLRPFAGAALGARQDNLSISDLYRSELLYRSAGILGKAYAGVRVCELPVSGKSGERLALDLGAGVSVVSRPFPPPGATLFVRIAVED